MLVPYWLISNSKSHVVRWTPELRTSAVGKLHSPLFVFDQIFHLGECAEFETNRYKIICADSAAASSQTYPSNKFAAPLFSTDYLTNLFLHSFFVGCFRWTRKLPRYPPCDSTPMGGVQAAKNSRQLCGDGEKGYRIVSILSGNFILESFLNKSTIWFVFPRCKVSSFSSFVSKLVAQVPQSWIISLD